MIPECIYISKIINKCLFSHYFGCFSSIFVYKYFFSKKKQFLAYLNSVPCITSYWLGVFCIVYYY